MSSDYLTGNTCLSVHWIHWILLRVFNNAAIPRCALAGLSNKVPSRCCLMTNSYRQKNTKINCVLISAFIDGWRWESLVFVTFLRIWNCLQLECKPNYRAVYTDLGAIRLPTKPNRRMSQICNLFPIHSQKNRKSFYYKCLISSRITSNPYESIGVKSDNGQELCVHKISLRKLCIIDNLSWRMASNAYRRSRWLADIRMSIR